MDRNRSQRILQNITWQAYQAAQRNQLNRRQIEALQICKLRELLIYVQQYSPKYRKDLAGLSLNDLTFEQFQNEVAPISKADFVNDWDQIVTIQDLRKSEVETFVNNEDPISSDYVYKNSYHVISTSGSSGISGLFLYTDNEWSSYCSQFHRHYREMRSSRPRMAHLSVRSRLFAMPRHMYSITSPGIVNLELDSSDSDQYIVEQLNSFQPQLLVTIPSILHKLSCWQFENELFINPQQINVGAEPLSPVLRENVRHNWPSTRLINTYAGSEGFAALGCEHNPNLMHFNEDYCFVEDNPNGGLLVTNLFARTVPVIRLEINDNIIFDSGKLCSYCGTAYQTIFEPQGRLSDDFLYDDGTLVSSLQMTKVLNQFPQVLEYQIHQSKCGIEVYIQSGFDIMLDLKTRLEKTLVLAGLSHPQVHVKNIAQLFRQRSGKLRRFYALNN